MATVYLDLNAATNGSGASSSDPFNNSNSAEAGAGAGGTIVFVANTTQDGNDWQNTYFDFDADVDIEAEIRRSVILKGGSQSPYVVRYSDPVDSEVSLQGVIVDPVTPSKGTSITYDNLLDAGSAPNYKLVDCQIQSGFTCGVDYKTRAGRLDIVNLDISGVLQGPAVRAISNISANGNSDLTIKGLSFNFTGSISQPLLLVQQVNSPSNEFNFSASAVNGTANFADSSAVIFVRVDSKDSINISDNNITLNGDNATSVTGLFAQGKGAGLESSQVNITNNNLKFNISAGYGISFGQSQGDSHITGGTVSGNTVVGKYYASATPHNILMGRGTSGVCQGNVSENSYVGILASICDSGTKVTANTLIDCYGPSLYCKGAIAVEIFDNVCLLTGKNVQRDRPIISVNQQEGGFNTLSATINNNLVIVKDLSKINALCGMDNENQAATFSRNVYIVDESQYVESTKYFSYKTTVPNNTIAEWNQQTEVTSDLILPLSASEIDSLIDNLKTTTGSASTPEGVISRGIVSQ